MKNSENRKKKITVIAISAAAALIIAAVCFVRFGVKGDHDAETADRISETRKSEKTSGTSSKKASESKKSSKDGGSEDKATAGEVTETSKSAKSDTKAETAKTEAKETSKAETKETSKAATKETPKAQAKETPKAETKPSSKHEHEWEEVPGAYTAKKIVDKEQTERVAKNKSIEVAVCNVKSCGHVFWPEEYGDKDPGDVLAEHAYEHALKGEGGGHHSELREVFDHYEDVVVQEVHFEVTILYRCRDCKETKTEVVSMSHQDYIAWLNKKK